MEFEEVEGKETNCKGKFYKGRVNGFVSTNGIYTYKETMTPLKRISCPGCEECGWIEDDLKEFVNQGTFPEVEGGIEHEAIYTITIINISKDWETGIVDDYDLIFVKVEE